MVSQLEVERRIDIKDVQNEGVSPEKFWSLRGKEPVSTAEIIRKYPQETFQLLKYKKDLILFLCRKSIIVSCGEIDNLQDQHNRSRTDFTSHFKEYGNSAQEIARRLEELAQAEKDERRKIASDTSHPTVIASRTRVELNDPKRRRLLGKVLVIIWPGIATEVSPSLNPLIKEKERLQQDSIIIEQRRHLLEKEYTESSAAFKDEEQQKQDALTNSLNIWVIENPARLITHLLQFPNETLALRRSFHRRYKNNPAFQEALEDLLEKPGLLDKPFNHVVSQASAKPAPEIRKGNQRERTVKKWDVIFPSNDDPKTLRSEAKIIEVIKSKLAEAGCPEWEQEKLVNSFLRFRNDPLHSVKVGVTQGGSVRDKLGKNKLYLDDNWRVLFNLNTGPHGESVIEVYAIIPHGEWDKMQR